MKKKSDSTGLTSGDLSALCRLIVAEKRRMKKTNSSRERVRLAIDLINRVLSDLLYELGERAHAAGVEQTRFILDAIEESREEQISFMDVFPMRVGNRPVVAVHTPKAERLASRKDANGSNGGSTRLTAGKRRAA